MDLASTAFAEPFIQLVLAMACGSVLGIERYFIGKVAGMRTYGLVSMGACLFILVTTLVGVDMPIVDFSPTQVMAGIITGIGFLGAGLIIFKDSKVTGLTTAAGLWVAAGIGIAIAYKLYGIAIFATLLTLFNFTILWRVETKLKEIAEKDIPNLTGQ